MGNKIRVELSHGGGRTAKYSSEPGACFRCGAQGHWARCVGVETVNVCSNGISENVPLSLDRKLISFDFSPA